MVDQCCSHRLEKVFDIRITTYICHAAFIVSLLLPFHQNLLSPFDFLVLISH